MIEAHSHSKALRPILESSNILITGGAGFLGSHLAELLVARGNHVYCLDNFHTGRVANLSKLQFTNRLSVVQHDVRDELPDSLPAFSEIYNLACPASPVHYQADPVATAMTNCQGAWNVLRRAERDGARVFHASTSEIYGDPEIHPQPEHYWGNVNSVGPRSCYDEGKRFAETLFTDFGKTRGVAVRIVRIFNTYGPRMQPDDGRVVSNFIIQALLGQPLTMYGDGQQTRSFCYVDDLIRGFDLLMRSELADSPVNIGNPGEFTMEELASLVLEITGSRSPVVRLPLPVDDPKRRKPDISKAKDLLGWKPEISLREGLIRTIEYFDRELRKQPAMTISAAE
ncbi:SDR family oxidoreductase [Rhizobium grahamii]|uniref:UDP-glucuronate decarboxylase n=1 Tax=Rhizobium grahamii TaxID=1120045 RepID=A0A5Q0C7T0_9HYPH|nr:MULTISPECIES: UDP-glucuronic acid decarboxylase family protein [Rhizobium]QFY61473.1 SDR family oxidoreductase [Rhizobium grahamii]QRM49374.1 SDR family oxidoreductase [Rhizobium sp. BG6]